MYSLLHATIKPIWSLRYMRMIMELEEFRGVEIGSF